MRSKLRGKTWVRVSVVRESVVVISGCHGGAQAHSLVHHLHVIAWLYDGRLPFNIERSRVCGDGEALDDGRIVPSGLKHEP